MARMRFQKNWKAEFGLTLEEAKQIALTRNGHLPRPGYEVCVVSDTQEVDISTTPETKPWLAEVDHKIYLINRAGKFELWQWWDVSPTKKNSSVGVGDETLTIRRMIRQDEQGIIAGLTNLLRRYNEMFVNQPGSMHFATIKLFQPLHGFEFDDEVGDFHDFNYLDDLVQFVESCIVYNQPASVRSGRVSRLNSIS